MRVISFILLLLGLCSSGFGHSLGNEIVRAVPQRKISDKICETPQCVDFAARLLKNMDATINPCDDFYSFVCGNYVKTTRIAEHKSSEGSFNTISDEIQEQLRTEFEKKSLQNDAKPFKLARDFYKICMDSTNIDKKSEQEFKQILERLGGWPVLKGDSWDEKAFDWRRVTPDFLKEGYWLDAFVRVDLDIDMKNNTKRIITLDQAALGLSQKYLARGADDPIVKAYYSYIVDLAVMFGADRKKAEKELLDSLNFEIALAKISLPMEKRRNYEDLYNMMRTHEITERYRDIEWIEYVNSILKPHTSLRNNELVNVAVLTYLDDLYVLLKSTPKRVLANYVIYRITKDSVPMLSERLRDRLTQFSQVLTGSSVKAPRWKKCVSDTSSTFNHAVSAIYVRNYFSMSARKNAEELINTLSGSFKNILNEINWMDEKTRKAALEKLENIVPHIAFPDELLSDQKLEDYYENLEFDSDSYLKTKLKINKFFNDKSFRKFREAVNVTDWETHVSSSVVNAFYMPSQNSIQFPAGILQGNFFGNERPKYTNYGGIGYVMGHEITHGFDDQGSQFDKFGNLLEWWEKETKKEYLNRAQCIIDQYSNFSVNGLHLNGINTQGENIADNGGIKESYFAYNAWEAKNGAEPRLPGLRYTSQQLFWISAATTWCEVYRPEALKSQITTGVHSPGRFRVIAPFSNMPEFSQDFNCPLGSTMNPVKKCTVW